MKSKIISNSNFERPQKTQTNELYQTPDYLTSADLADEKLYEIIKNSSGS